MALTKAPAELLNLDSGITITTADNTEQLTLLSTDADASQGPSMAFYRNSSSPADSDDMGNIYFYGENDNDEKIEYGRIRSILLDASDGTEDSNIRFWTMNAGTLTDNLALAGGSVGIGVSAPNSKLHVDGAEDYTGGIVISAGAQLHSWFLSSDLVNVHNVHSASASAAHTWQLNATEVTRITPSGLTFNGDTAAANALDDYEEGAWTPDIKINDSTTGITYTARSADYVKIGKLVFVNGDIQLSDKGSSSGSVIISGLPFTVVDRTSATSIDGGASLCAHSSGTSNLYTPIGLTGVGAATTINMYYAASSGATMASNLTDSKITDAFSIRFSLTYTAS